MTRFIQLLGKPGTTVLIVALIAALAFCSWQHIVVPDAIDYLVTALLAGNLYGQVPPHARVPVPAPASENGDAESSAA